VKDEFHKARILIIDDEGANVLLLERMLRAENFVHLASTTDSRDAARLFAEFEPDLVLTDWMMPHADGFAVIQQLRALIATDDYLPILVLTADVTQTTRQAALAAGATDYLTKPFDRIEVLLRISNLLTTRFSHLRIQDQNASLEQNVRERTIALERALEELRTTQQHVIQQERLAALGTMAGGIAHDFNNALSIILGYGELLLRDAEEGLTKENVESAVKMIITAAEDGANIVHRLHEFHRPGSSGDFRLPIDLNSLIDQAVTLTRPRWHTQSMVAGRPITMTTDLSTIPMLLGDAAELREAVANLIFNAVDAMKEAGGTISIRTRADGETVLLEIADTGAGMTEEVRARCLEPFFTTKGDQGTGLGLAMVFGIIQRHGGTIDIDSTVGVGTTFTLRFPAHTPTEGVEFAGLVAAGRPLHILLVEDQPVLCELLSEYLTKDCHTVESASDGSAALEKYGVDKFDVVITDQAMPQMNGVQLANELKRRNPEQRIVLLTGVGEADLRETGDIDVFVQKPVSLAALRQALVQATSASGDHVPPSTA
jgi:signal transduction histidine kinase